jgi:hypothetical protein
MLAKNGCRHCFISFSNVSNRNRHERNQCTVANIQAVTDGKPKQQLNPIDMIMLDLIQNPETAAVNKKLIEAIDEYKKIISKYC